MRGHLKKVSLTSGNSQNARKSLDHHKPDTWFMFRDSDDEYRYLMPPIEIDGVRSLAGPRSFLVNLGEMDAFAVEESFLFPSSSPDAFLHHPVPRRERPVSTQTMPLSSRRTRETRWERSDCAWMLEESSPELKAQEFVDAEEEIRPDDVDEPHMADWRQFHLDLLQTIR